MTHYQLENAIIGTSPAIRELRRVIRQVAPSSTPILIQGPTGSGKELVAEALHYLSRRPGRFVPFNVCAISEGMLEDALFGHVKGAFTGAVTDHTGFLSEADRGTLFLDEIGSIGRAAQAKLLRVLETQTYRVIGSAADRKSNFRTVAATNEPLEELTLRGLFREDLMWRLRGLVLHVPALSRRLEDVPLLARHFARQASTALGRHIDLSEEALDVLGDHNWPGHVRELRRAVEAAAALSFNESISAEEIRNVLRNTMVSRAHGERDQLRHVLQSVNGDIDAAAEVLGVHRVTIYRRLKRLGITRSLVSDELPSRVQLQE